MELGMTSENNIFHERLSDPFLARGGSAAARGNNNSVGARAAVMSCGENLLSTQDPTIVTQMIAGLRVNSDPDHLS